MSPAPEKLNSLAYSMRGVDEGRRIVTTNLAFPAVVTGKSAAEMREMIADVQLEGREQDSQSRFADCIATQGGDANRGS